MITKNKQGKVAGVLTLLVAFSLVIVQQLGGNEGESGVSRMSPAAGSPVQPGVVGEQELGEEQILIAFRNERSDIQVEVQARVVRELPDDLDGNRHQRFILEFAKSEHTVLISHNIDLAPRVPVTENDWVRVMGEYEWSQQGGVIHWTHHNPARNPIHPPGWVEHAGIRYD